MENLIRKVEDWARVRKLHNADPKAQALKVIEEFTEMVVAFNDYTALNKYLEQDSFRDDLNNLKNETIDGIGDTYVTLIILCQQLDIDFKKTEVDARFISTSQIAKVLNWFATGVSKGDIKAIGLGVMDMVGIAKNIAYYIDIEPHDCLSVAYDEIKDRKGMLIDGTFVKYDDLSAEQQIELDNADGCYPSSEEVSHETNLRI